MEKTIPEISIIVPVYNVEKYLPKTLDSILAQSFTDWECVVVDDGAKDGSGAVCDAYGAKDPRFKVVHKENGGLSSARNCGLQHISGRYVAFVDSDDWLDPEYLSTLHRLITEHEADVVQCGFWKEYSTYTRIKPLIKNKKLVRENKVKVLDAAHAFVALVDDDELPSFVWNKLYRRDIITEPFPEGKVFEDIYVMSYWFRNVRKVVLTPQPLYHYRMRQGSIMHSNFCNNLYDYITNSMDRARVAHDLYPKLFPEKDLNEALFRFAVNGAKTIARKELDEEKRMEFIRRISTLLQGVNNPGIFMMGFKQWERGSNLKHRPEAFHRIVRISFRTDFHAKYRNKKFFD